MSTLQSGMVVNVFQVETFTQSGYKEHGESDECFDGEGGHDAMNVYNITGNI